jgi:hypothetical protein
MTLPVLKGTFVTCLALAAIAAGARGAQAGSYHVYGCRTPLGESAPADGWSGSVTGTAVYAENTCQQGGALLAALGPAKRTASTDIASWTFEAPVGESIAGATLWRSGDADGGSVVNASYQYWLAGPAETNIFDECLGCTGRGNPGEPLAGENRVVVPAANLGARLYAIASCGGVADFSCKEGEHDANGYAAAVYVYAADLLLQQSFGPTAGNVNGELASAAVVRGDSDLTFTATDPGAGVYEAVFRADGQVVQSTVVDENGGRCRNVGQTTDGLAAFLYVHPCLASVSANVPFDTTKVANGSHHLVVSVIDAAGNAAPVLDRQITVANPPPPGPANGVNASAQASLSVTWKGTSKQQITRSYGRSATVTGRLTGPGGVPISGALIDLVANPAYVGAKPVAMSGPRTAADGRFSMRLRGGISSRTLHFAYSTHLGEAPSVTARALRLGVRAGIRLSVTPRSASVGRSIFFRGRLLGGPIPAGGKQLVLEARSPGGRWIEFDVISTDAHGRYHSSYTFKFAGPAAYQFRVRSERESDFPFGAGSSNVVGVLEH